MLKNIAIIGGGIAGLAFAVYYKKLGGRADIYERSPISGREGLGFIMLENGLKAMSSLGLLTNVSQAGYPLESCSILDSNENTLINETLIGSYGITRKAFVEVLLAQIPSQWLHFDHSFSHFIFDDEGYAKTAIFDNKLSISADLFLGCDGGNSAVRAQIKPNAVRSKIKVQELVSIVENPLLVTAMDHRFTKYKCLNGGLAAGVVPASKNSLVWFIQFDVNKYDLSDSSVQGKINFANNTLHHWPNPIQQLIKCTDFSRSHIAKSSYLEPLERYHRNNVVLLGDAAHALLPFTSQGVNAAIEDAIELAKILSKSKKGFLNVALEHYSVMRKPILEQFLRQGIALQEEFLLPHKANQKIPFAF